jgi:hypothetical protein
LVDPPSLPYGKTSYYALRATKDESEGQEGFLLRQGYEGQVEGHAPPTSARNLDYKFRFETNGLDKSSPYNKDFIYEQRVILLFIVFWNNNF